MADTDSSGANNRGTALATIAILLAPVAAGLAFMANKRANDAFRAVQPVTQQPVSPTTGPEGTTPTNEGFNNNGNGTTPGTNGIPPAAPTIDQ